MVISRTQRAQTRLLGFGFPGSPLSFRVPPGQRCIPGQVPGHCALCCLLSPRARSLDTASTVSRAGSVPSKQLLARADGLLMRT